MWLSLAVQPFASVVVTLYVVDETGETLMKRVVSSVDQA